MGLGSIRAFCFIRWLGHIKPDNTSYALRIWRSIFSVILARYSRTRPFLCRSHRGICSADDAHLDLGMRFFLKLLLCATMTASRACSALRTSRHAPMSLHRCIQIRLT